MLLYFTGEKQHLKIWWPPKLISNKQNLKFMKKVMVLFAAFMLLGSVGAFAGKSSPLKEKRSATELKNTIVVVSDLSGVFSTSCGYWNFEITCPSCSCSQLTSALLQLIGAAEAACLTGETYVEIEIEP